MDPRHPEIPSEQRYLDDAIRRAGVDRAAKAKAPLAAADSKTAGYMKRNPGQALGTNREVDKTIIGRLDGEFEMRNGKTISGPFYLGIQAVLGEGGRFAVYHWAEGILGDAYHLARPGHSMGVSRKRTFSIRSARIEAIDDKQISGRPSAPPDESDRSSRLDTPELVESNGRSKSAADAPPPSTAENVVVPVFDSTPPPRRVKTESAGSAEEEVFELAEDPLLAAALNSSRTPTMRNIVGTIARSQYELIASPHEGLNVIQGGPGTGKTAVAVQRAAWLLYRRRDEIQRGGGVLIVGPNTAFIEYIRDVLPGLGEQVGEGGAVQLSIDRLVSDSSIRAVKTESEELAALKGDARMAEVLRNALYSHIRRPEESITFKADGKATVIDAETINQLIDDALARKGTYRARRSMFQSLLLGAARRRERGIRSFNSDQVDRVWPNRSEVALLRDFFNNPTRRAEAASGILEDGEISLLQRKQESEARSEPWTSSDIALLDEARALIDGDQPRYAYVIVDEVQDLTPMQLRMLARRMRSSRGMFVGDLAQATGPVRYPDWESVLTGLGGDFEVELDELGSGYRVPRQVMKLASVLVPRVVANLKAPEAIRDGDEEPRLFKVDGAEVFDYVEQEVRRRAGNGRRIGVIVPAELSAQAFDHFDANSLDHGTIPKDGLTREVTVLTAKESKGLEFDHVVVAEPHRIAGEKADWASLYVALTRATQTLSIVHTCESAVPEESEIPGSRADVAREVDTSVRRPVERSEGSPVLGALFSEAFLRAKFLHDGQSRKGSLVPYLAHLMAVSAMVLDDGGSETEAIAALFHDVVEDYGEEELEWVRLHFGDEVAEIVIGCADPDLAEGMEWREMKEQHLRVLESAGPQVRRVALAEKLENARNILRSRKLNGDEHWKHMEVDASDLLWYLQALADLFMAERPGYMAEQLSLVVDELLALETEPDGD